MDVIQDLLFCIPIVKTASGFLPWQCILMMPYGEKYEEAYYRTDWNPLKYG